jgi:hypothetical protein
MSTDDEDIDNTGLYVVVSFYFLALIVVTVLTVLKQRKAIAEAARLAAAEGETAKDHFLAGKDVGLFLLFISVFSTTVSGYSVVGVPGEAAATGFLALRWFGVYTYPAVIYCMVRAHPVCVFVLPAPAFLFALRMGAFFIPNAPPPPLPCTLNNPDRSPDPSAVRRARLHVPSGVLQGPVPLAPAALCRRGLNRTA